VCDVGRRSHGANRKIAHCLLAETGFAAAASASAILVSSLVPTTVPVLVLVRGC
jgi:hypothetical protein